MTSFEMYEIFLNMVEENNTNNNLHIDKQRFVTWFNSISPKYQSYVLDKRNEDAIREMAPLLRKEKLALVESLSTYDEFLNPDDYFDSVNLYISAKKGACKASDFLLQEVKPENLHLLLVDPTNTPSFKAREALYHFENRGVVIYHNGDFKIESVTLNYYKKIPKIDISGYVHDDNTPSTDINADELLDITKLNILTRMAVNFAAAEGDTSQFQMQSALKINN